MTFSRALNDAPHMQNALSWNELASILQHIQEHNCVNKNAGKEPALKKVVPHMDVSGGWVHILELHPTSGSRYLTIEHRFLPKDVRMYDAVMTYLREGLKEYRSLVGIETKAPAQKKSVSATQASPFAQPTPRF